MYKTSTESLNLGIDPNKSWKKTRTTKEPLVSPTHERRFFSKPLQRVGSSTKFSTLLSDEEDIRVEEERLTCGIESAKSNSLSSKSGTLASTLAAIDALSTFVKN